MLISINIYQQEEDGEEGNIWLPLLQLPPAVSTVVFPITTVATDDITTATVAKCK